MGTIVDYHGDQQREAEFQESLKLIQKSDYPQYQSFSTINESNLVKEYEEFKEEVSSMIEKTNALTGSLYTDEGKRALIVENIDKLKQKYIDKEAERILWERTRVEKLRTELIASIANTSYTSPDSNQKMQDLEAHTRSKLAFANHAREVEGILKDLVIRSEHDKTAAVFVTKYAYLFAEKASALAKEGDKPASLHHIKTLVDQAQDVAHGPITKVRMEMLNRLEHKGQTSSVSKRLIELNASTFKKKYQ